MANVFFSHRTAYMLLAERFVQALAAAGHQVWFNEWEISIGDSIVERVNHGLECAAYLLLCYSAWTRLGWQATMRTRKTCG